MQLSSNKNLLIPLILACGYGVCVHVNVCGLHCVSEHVGLNLRVDGILHQMGRERTRKVF